MVTRKQKRREELLTDMMSQRRAVVNDHLSGRESLDDEVSTQNRNEFALFSLRLLLARQYLPPQTLNLLQLNITPTQTCAQELARHERQIRGSHRKLLGEDKYAPGEGSKWKHVSARFPSLHNQMKPSVVLC